MSPLRTTIIHEFGHILGFGHPDEHYYYNYDAKYLYDKCVVKKYINHNYDKNSIMNSVSVRTKTSLTTNDKLGIYDLYPSCNYSNYIYSNFKMINDDNMLFLMCMVIYISIFPTCYFTMLIYSKIVNEINL